MDQDRTALDYADVLQDRVTGEDALDYAVLVGGSQTTRVTISLLLVNKAGFGSFDQDYKPIIRDVASYLTSYFKNEVPHREGLANKELEVTVNGTKLQLDQQQIQALKRTDLAIYVMPNLNVDVLRSISLLHGMSADRWDGLKGDLANEQGVRGFGPTVRYFSHPAVFVDTQDFEGGAASRKFEARLYNRVLHELGHSLLGYTQHPAKGVMQAALTGEEPRLGFVEDDKKMLENQLTQTYFYLTK
jgi:hypothetical protein